MADTLVNEEDRGPEWAEEIDSLESSQSQLLRGYRTVVTDVRAFAPRYSPIRHTLAAPESGLKKLFSDVQALKCVVRRAIRSLHVPDLDLPGIVEADWEFVT